jgi:hypothetical protein
LDALIWLAIDRVPSRSAFGSDHVAPVFCELDGDVCVPVDAAVVLLDVVAAAAWDVLACVVVVDDDEDFLLEPPPPHAAMAPLIITAEITTSARLYTLLDIASLPCLADSMSRTPGSCRRP